MIVGLANYILAIDDQLDGGGNGGTLRISFNEAPPPPTVDVTVDPVGTFDARSGAVTLTGTYTCTDADFIDVFEEVRQSVGRFVITGYFSFFAEGTCDGTPQPWTATVTGSNGKFAGGKALTIVFSFACGPFECAEGYTEQTVRLTGRKR